MQCKKLKILSRRFIASLFDEQDEKLSDQIVQAMRADMMVLFWAFSLNCVGATACNRIRKAVMDAMIFA